MADGFIAWPGSLDRMADGFIPWMDGGRDRLIGSDGSLALDFIGGTGGSRDFAEPPAIEPIPPCMPTLGRTYERSNHSYSSCDM
jgi:hypothetical protein|uniref:Uncharacterized protein n=2 Tax=Picea TaxID=3328 RepID=A0A101LX77_PICGL|nr:hypothetical protein ABT39_MTgene5999 [Picea glauca]QHR91452.1 hypothetical protein Q903MT_gene5486 [Picea sitchensis]